MRVCVCSTLNNHTIELHLFHVIPFHTHKWARFSRRITQICNQISPDKCAIGKTSRRYYTAVHSHITLKPRLWVFHPSRHHPSRQSCESCVRQPTPADVQAGCNFVFRTRNWLSWKIAHLFAGELWCVWCLYDYLWMCICVWGGGVEFGYKTVNHRHDRSMGLRDEWLVCISSLICM